MKNEKIYVNKNDYHRVLLTDLLPYEVPLIFSNEGFYYLLTNQYEPLPAYIKDTVLKLNQLPMKDIKYTIPFNYKIKKHLDSFRTLSIIHPSLQNYFVDFYKQYDLIMLHLCDKSPFSLRKPTKIANAYYEKTLLSDRETENQIEVSRDGFSKQPEYANSYFLYSKYSFMHKFFSSYEMNRLEKKFAYMMSLDISKCFYNIYTHSLCWAVKEKAYSKTNAGKVSFENLFDTLMQKSNYNETNGIVVGPEISRIFAEIIFQDIDLNVLKILKEEYNLEHKIHYDIKRYVDDYFIYSNDKNTLEQIHKILEKKLEEYKLYFNDSKKSIFLPPFISDISIAKIEISQLFERSIGSFIEIDHSSKKVQFKKLNAYYSKSNYFISEIKKILKQNNLKYENVSSYLFSIFKKRLLQIFNSEQSYEIDNQNIEEFLLYVLDILFFLYALALRVNTTYTISYILLMINKVIDHLPYGKQNNIRKKIYDEVVFVIKKWCYIDHEISLEVLNLLIVLRGLGDHFKIPEEQLRNILNLETIEKLNYFQIISILYYIADDSKYKKLQTDIINYVIGIYKNNEKTGIFLETELSLLLLDFVSCPYIPYKKKNYLMCLLITNNHVERKEVLEYVMKYQWFTNWQEVSMERLLLKKELKFGYEK